MMQALTHDTVLSGLTTRYIGRNVTYLPRVGSTNDAARALAEQGAPEGTVVVADEQTEGRGRLARRWIAPAGSSLLLSVILYPPLAPSQAPRLTMLCSLAIVDAIEELTGLQLGIKWPNDVVVMQPPHEGNRAGHSEVGNRPPSQRKLAGLLAESSVTGPQLAYVVVGIGINVNLDVDALAETAFPATSLSAELGHPMDRLALLWAILGGIERRYEAARDPAGGLVAVRQTAGGFLGIHREWSLRLVTRGQRVRVSDGGVVAEGYAEGVDEDGALLVRGAGAQLHRIAVGDVSLRPTG